MPNGPAGSPTVVDLVDAGFPRAVRTLGELVRIPSVSWPGFDVAAVHRSAEAVAALARELGIFDEVAVRTAPRADGTGEGHPAVLATRAARNGAPTVLLYAHHDVQPPGDPAAWATDPFEPTVRGERLHGRGASDDKAGVVSHLAALEALRDRVGGDVSLGVVLFIEGEEEHGSPSFSAFLEQYREQLRSDVMIVADSGNWTTDVPAITTGLRGNVGFNLRVSTLDHASHSGMFGGAVPDAVLAAVRVLGSLWADDGSVAVPGLTRRDAVVPDYDDARLRAEAGLLDGVRPIGSGPVLSRMWDAPSVTVTGIDVPDVRNASNTLTASVRVRISVRIAPGQDAREAFAAVEAHLRAAPAFGAHLEFADVEYGDGYLVDESGWAVAEAEAAMREAWGVDAVRMGIGGSIPFIPELVRVFPDAQVLVTGVEDTDTRAHAPDESQHLGVLRRAIAAEALLLERLDRRRLGA